MGLSDTLLASGAALHVEAVHGERVLILTGQDKDKVFIATREIDSDVVLNEPFFDARAKRLLRFRDVPGQSKSVPRLSPQDRLQTEDGKVWFAVVYPQNSYLETVYELVEKLTKDQ